jgi:NAD(P)-dependent dehydrogenase (short-subunit alcohol dehydrogenase family)
VTKRVLVVGASGDVGQGVIAAAAAKGWAVVAAARSGDKLAPLQAEFGASVVQGDLISEEAASALWSAAEAVHGGIDAAVVSVNAPNTSRQMLEWIPDELASLVAHNVLTHFIAAKTFLPLTAASGYYVGIGGGAADFVIPELGHLSLCQAALRMMYRAIGCEREAGPALRQLTIASMVAGPRKRAVADPNWLTNLEVGRHVCAILAEPQAFPDAIQRLQSRDQIGRPAH